MVALPKFSFRARFSNGLGYLFSYTAFVVPYLLIGIIEQARLLNQLLQEHSPLIRIQVLHLLQIPWLTGLVVSLVVLTYFYGWT